MRKLTLGLVLAASLLSAAPVFALRTEGNTVIIPVIGRFPGTGGTQWRTDVFIHNAYMPGQTVTLRFYPTGGAMLQRTVTLQQYSGAHLPDVVLNTFSMPLAAGVLEVSGQSILARARIYNTGNPAGEFGQSVPGIAKERLSRQALLHGISGAAGNRVNIGVANPNDVPVTVALYIGNATNIPLHSQSVTLQPHSYVQFSDIFNTFGIAPQTAVAVQFNAVELPIYGYASEVRNDTGDAVFTFGTNPNA
ncbi:MAG TPA: hypothetical protein VF432_14805 [Thermoanaerobaculia bacterium]